MKNSLSYQQQLAVDAWQLIAKNPKSWNQRHWRSPGSGGEETRCGAKLCWGGHVVVLDGGNFVVNDPANLFADRLLANPGEKRSQKWNLTVGETPIEISVIDVFNRLRNIFGAALTSDELEALIDGENTLDDLKELIIDHLGVNPETGELVTRDVYCKYGYKDCTFCH